MGVSPFLQSVKQLQNDHEPIRHWISPAKCIHQIHFGKERGKYTSLPTSGPSIFHPASQGRRTPRAVFADLTFPGMLMMDLLCGSGARQCCGCLTESVEGAKSGQASRSGLTAMTPYDPKIAGGTL